MILKSEDESTPGSESWPFFYECTTLKMCNLCAPCPHSIALRVSVWPHLHVPPAWCESGQYVCEVVCMEASPCTAASHYWCLCGRSCGAKTLHLPGRRILSYCQELTVRLVHS